MALTVEQVSLNLLRKKIFFRFSIARAGDKPLKASMQINWHIKQCHRLIVHRNVTYSKNIRILNMTALNTQVNK